MNKLREEQRELREQIKEESPTPETAEK
jgi:hypothetical protein